MGNSPTPQPVLHVHCLSSSGRRGPNELSTERYKSIIDELQRIAGFYVSNIGGERADKPLNFWSSSTSPADHQVGVKFSTSR